MSVAAVCLAVYVVLSFLYWLRTLQCTFRTVRSVPLVADLNAAEPANWPKLSVVVPACNEEGDIETALESLLSEDYPNIEFILVNDRSTDATGRIMDRMAAEDLRARVIHVTQLPEGWLGKVNALEQGYRGSTGDLVLFTDADVHYARGGLRKVVAWSEAERLDHVAAFPEAWSSSFVLDALIVAFVRQFVALLVRPWEVRDPKARGFVGIGAFNLVRRSAFEKTPGFEWIRLEVADDLGVGFMMKRSGARCAVVAGFDFFALYWYRSLRHAMRGGEKAYAVFGCKLVMTIMGAFVSLLLEVAPVVLPLLLLSARHRVAGYAGIGVLATFVLSVITISGWAGGRRVAAGLASPFVAPIMAAMAVRAAVLGHLRGGVVWRGTLYRSEMLREGRRVKLF